MLNFTIPGGCSWDVNTLHSIQNSVYDGADRILDVAHHPSHKLIGNGEDTSADDHGVNVAEINTSWEKKVHIINPRNSTLQIMGDFTFIYAPYSIQYGIYNST